MQLPMVSGLSMSKTNSGDLRIVTQNLAGRLKVKFIIH